MHRQMLAETAVQGRSGEEQRKADKSRNQRGGMDESIREKLAVAVGTAEIVRQGRGHRAGLSEATVSARPR